MESSSLDLYGVSHIRDHLTYLYEGYQWTLTFSDQRVADWPLMSSPVYTVAFIMFYLSAIRWGPQIMKYREPFHFSWVLVIYNIAVMLLNLYIAVELLTCALHLKYNWFCQLVDYSDNPYELRIAKALWWYYFSKLVEFNDTFFFILRKKNNQLTFLHVYHHSTMFGLWWIGVKWVPGGSALPGAMANSFVHVLMYAYYGLSALGPAIQRFLWWKKYLTVIQLVQFSTAMAMGINAIITGCQFTRWMQYALVAYSFSFLVLFGDFYRRSYMNEGKKTKGANGVCANGTTHVIKNGYVDHSFPHKLHHKRIKPQH